MSYKVEIFDQVLKRDKDGNVISKFAILMCLDRDTLNQAIAQYVGKVPHNQFVNITLCDPWTRVIISGITDLKLSTPETIERRNKLEKLNNISDGV